MTSGLKNIQVLSPLPHTSIRFNDNFYLLKTLETIIQYLHLQKKLCYNEKYWTYMCLLIKKYCIFNANFLRQIKH